MIIKIIVSPGKEPYCTARPLSFLQSKVKNIIYMTLTMQYINNVKGRYVKQK